MKRIATLFLACLLTLNLLGCSKEIDPAAQIVIDEITELTESDQIDFAALEKAKERYNSLTDDQKKQVTNYAELLKLEDSYQDAVEAAITEAEYNDTHIPNTDFLLPDFATDYTCSKKPEDLGPWGKGENGIRFTYKTDDEALHAMGQYAKYIEDNYGYLDPSSQKQPYVDKDGNKMWITPRTSGSCCFEITIDYK